MSVLERDLAAAKAMTCGAGIPPVGDTGLWEGLDAAMHRARAHVPAATSAHRRRPNRRENPARGGDLGPVTPGRMAPPRRLCSRIVKAAKQVRFVGNPAAGRDGTRRCTY